MVWNVDILTVVCGAGTLGRRRTAAAVLHVLTDGFGIRPHLLLDGRLALRCDDCGAAHTAAPVFVLTFEFLTILSRNSAEIRGGRAPTRDSKGRGEMLSDSAAQLLREQAPLRWR